VSTARRLLAGAGWVYGAQVATVVAQVGYAASTSRLASPSSFGSYSIAITATGLITLLAAGGLGQTVGRLRSLSEPEMTTLSTYSVLLGTVSACCTIVLAPALASLWGDPAAGPVVRLLAVNAFTAPLFGVATGLMIRLGTFKKLAAATLITNLVGMSLGLLFVFLYANAAALVVSAIVSQTCLTAYATMQVRSYIRFGRLARGSEALGFSGRVILSQIMQYMLGNASRLTAARVIGRNSIGQWNRAEVLSTLPFQQVQAVIVQVLYPEFRHDRDSTDRAQRVWADLLGFVAWVTWPLGALAAGVLSAAIPLLFGTKWSMAASYSIPLAIAGGIQPVVILLASAVEALGHFRVIWLINGIQLILQIGLASLVVVGHTIWPAIFGLLVLNVASHIFYVLWCGSAGYLDTRRLARHYSQALFASLLVGLPVALTVQSLVRRWSHLLPIVGLVTSSMVMAYAWHGRRNLPPVVLAKRFGLLRQLTTATGPATTPDTANGGNSDDESGPE
jgi:O-antigen/teichoic acid export membrane protein